MWKKSKDIPFKQFLLFRLLVPIICVCVITTFIVGAIMKNLYMVLVSGGIAFIVTSLGFIAAFFETINNFRPSTEADRIRAAKWIATHPERYRAYQKEYEKKNREARNKKERERYAREHPHFKRITKYRKREEGKVILKEKPKPIIKAKKPTKPVEVFTSNPSIISHVKWLKEHSKKGINE